MPVAVAQIRLTGFVITRFANVPVVAPTVPNVALEAFTIGAEREDAAIVPAEIDPAVTVPRFEAPVTVNALTVVVAREDDPATVSPAEREKLEPAPFVKARL